MTEKFILLTCISFLFLAACAAEKEKPRPEMPFFVDEGKGVFINTFSISQGDFPQNGRMESLNPYPDWVLVPEEKARAVIEEVFVRYGVKLQKNYQFDFGKLQVQLDGYDRSRETGYFYITEDDYEKPRQASNERAGFGRFGYFFTEKDPQKMSLAELALLEQYCLFDKFYVALINGHQIGYRATGDAAKDAAAEELQLKRLRARTEMFVAWVGQRIARANAAEEKKAEK